jgi:hypothetical protein
LQRRSTHSRQLKPLQRLPLGTAAAEKIAKRSERVGDKKRVGYEESGSAISRCINPD